MGGCEMEQGQTFKRWLYLLSGIVLIGLFIFVVAPFVENQSSTFQEFSGFIDTHDIDTGAYAFMDSELAGKAAIGARSTMEYFPAGPK